MLLPTLSPSGWIKNKQAMLEKIYAYYLTSYFRQSTMFSGTVRTLNEALMSDSSPYTIRDNIISGFTELLSSYFDPSEIEVNATVTERSDDPTIDPKLKNIVVINLDVTINDSETGRTYSLTRDLYTQNNRLLYMETMRARVANYTDVERRNV